MFKKAGINMKKVAIVSCDKWKDRLEEDINLKKALIKLGVDAKIISWQQPLEEKYDLLVLITHLQNLPLTTSLIYFDILTKTSHSTSDTKSFS